MWVPGLVVVNYQGALDFCVQCRNHPAGLEGSSRLVYHRRSGTGVCAYNVGIEGEITSVYAVKKVQ